MTDRLHYVNGDDKISTGDYFILVIIDRLSVIQKINKHEYILIKLKNKTQTIYQVTKGKINNSGSIEYKEVYKKDNL